MTRRDKGSGTIYLDEKTNRWIGQLDLGKDATGKRRRRKFTGVKRADVAKEMRDVRRELDSGHTLGKASDTMAALLTDYLVKGLPSSARAEKTIDGYRFAIEQHLIPAIGGRKVRELSVDDVDDMLREKATGDRPLSRATLCHIHGVLRRALRWGQQRGRVSRNVAELVDTPQGARRVGKALTVAQAQRVIELATEEPLEALYLLGIAVPCRPGELTGLPWSAVDFDAEVIHFRQALHHAVDGTLYLGPLKTEQSRRSVAAPTFVIDALRRRKVAQVADRLKLPADEQWGPKWVADATTSLDSDLVFTTATGGPIDSSNLRRSFGKLLKRAGVSGSWTTYELRHSAVSILSAEGVPLEQIADAAGHRNSHVTATVYRHNLAPVVISAKGPMQTRFGKPAADAS